MVCFASMRLNPVQVYPTLLLHHLADTLIANDDYFVFKNETNIMMPCDGGVEYFLFQKGIFSIVVWRDPYGAGLPAFV